MFRNTFRLPFNLLGIPVRLDITFLIVLPLLAWIIGAQLGRFVVLFNLPIDPAPLTEGFTPYLLGLLAALGLFFSVVVHELGHSVVARGYGVKVKDITLWLLGGMAQLEEMPRQRGAEAVVAIAGPITSLILAGVFWVILNLIPTGAPGVFFVFSYLAYINVVLAIFNLLPALPLDGGRILRSLLALRTTQLHATRIAGAISKILALLLGLFGFLTLNLFMLLIAFFIFIAVSGETQYAIVTEVLEGVKVEDVMTREVASVPPHLPVTELIQKMLKERHLGYPVVDETGALVGLVDLEHAQDVSSEATVADIMIREVQTIPRTKSALDAFQNISRNNYRRLVVVDTSGKMVGVISKTDLVRTIQVRLVSVNLLPEIERERELVRQTG